jgi:hypothetical protein
MVWDTSSMKVAVVDDLPAIGVSDRKALFRNAKQPRDACERRAETR